MRSHASFKRKGLKGNWQLLNKLSGIPLEWHMHFQEKKKKTNSLEKRPLNVAGH